MVCEHCVDLSVAAVVCDFAHVAFPLSIADISPPVPVMELFRLVDFSLVRWDLIGEILPTWVGMVFVVSFASCLDVVRSWVRFFESLLFSSFCFK